MSSTETGSGTSLILCIDPKIVDFSMKGLGVASLVGLICFILSGDGNRSTVIYPGEREILCFAFVSLFLLCFCSIETETKRVIES